MSIEHSNIYIEQDGKMIPPDTYIFIQRTGEEYELLMDAGLGDIMNSIMLLWAAIREQAADLSDQDLYELCEDFEIDYDVFRRQIRSNNG